MACFEQENNKVKISFSLRFSMPDHESLGSFRTMSSSSGNAHPQRSLSGLSFMPVHFPSVESLFPKCFHLSPSAFAAIRHKAGVFCGRWDCPRGRDPHSGASSTSIHTGHPNPTRGWARCSCCLIPKGILPPAAFPSRGVRWGGEKGERSSMEHPCRASGSGRDTCSTPMNQHRAAAAAAECVTASPGPCRALLAPGLALSLLLLPGMSACNPALLPAASEGKAPSLLLCSHHRCVAQGWIWPKFDLFIFPMLYRVLKPQVSKALNHMLNLKHMLKCLIRALLLKKAQSYDSIWSNWVEKLRFPAFSFAYLDVHIWAKLFTLNLFIYILF